MTDLLSMDEILTAPARPADPTAPWPISAAKHGAVYGFTCPTHCSAMVAMTQSTFLELGTHTEALRRAAQDLDKKLKTLAAEHAELQIKHQNLREATRRDRLARLEDRIVLPENGGKVQIKTKR